MKPRYFALALTGCTCIAANAKDSVLQSFEGDGFGDWKVEGTAFGLAPVAGRMEGLNGDLSEFSGGSLACSAHGGDAATGSLTSPEFTLSEAYLAFLVAGGDQAGKTAVQLLIDGKVAMEATGRNDLVCRRIVWNLGELRGKKARIRILDDATGSWGLIAADHFMLTGASNPKMPPPKLGRSSGAGDMIPTSAIAGLSIPFGSKATVAATHADQGVTSPTAIAFDEAGAIFVAETHRFRFGVEDNRDHLYWYLDDLAAETMEDRTAMFEKFKKQVPPESLTEKSEVIRRLTAQNDAGTYTKSNVYADGFNHALDGTAAGIFAFDGTVFFANIPKIYALRDTDHDGEVDERRVIQDGFGVRVSFSGHDLNGFALGPDGRIYATIGDRGFNFTTSEGTEYKFPDQGAIFRFDPDGSNFEMIHRGLRNPKEIAFDDHGNGISVDNNSDQGDEARIVYIVDGADSGWRMEHQALHSFHRQIGLENLPVNRWMAEKMWEEPNSLQPGWLLPPVANLTSGPSGLTYHPGVGFLESEVGRFLICDYRGGAAASGIWSFQVEPEGAGMKLTNGRRFSWGAAVTDVEYTWDGRVMVSDFIDGWSSHDDGRIFEIQAEEMHRADEAQQAAELIAAGFEHRDEAELASLLGHGDQRVRTRAELALTRKQGAVAALTTAAKQGTELARLHGVWGLGVIARRGAAVLPDGSGETFSAQSDRRVEAAKALAGLLGDPNSEVRAQTAKALGESGLTELDGAKIDLTPLIREDSARVRMFATLAAARIGDANALPAIREMIIENDGSDPYLRHAGSHALQALEAPAELANLASHSNPALRHAAVIALGKLGDPRTGDFIADEDPQVSREAILLVHDTPIDEARPLVAAVLDRAPSSDLPEMMWRRLLHSSFRLGDARNVSRVLKIALAEEAPAFARSEALRLLDEWNAPNPVDQSLGRWNPLDQRKPEIARNVLQNEVTALLEIEAKFLEAAIKVVEAHQLDFDSVPDQTLKALVLGEKFPGPARARALDLYAARLPSNLGAFLVQLAGADDDALALAAIRKLVIARSPDAVSAVQAAVKSAHPVRQQEAWKIAATMEDNAIADLIQESLRKLIGVDGKDPAAIELLDAARGRTEPSIAQTLKDYDDRIAGLPDKLAKWNVSLLGGNPEAGRKLFESHPAGQCMRCHMADEAGGHGASNAGPDLAGIGKLRDRTYLLESVVEPGLLVAPGFGIVSITLKNGDSTGGIVLKDEADAIELDIAGETRTIQRADIATITDPVSAMPPMGLLLQPTEVRDLVEWLTTLKK